MLLQTLWSCFYETAILKSRKWHHNELDVIHPMKAKRQDHICCTVPMLSVFLTFLSSRRVLGCDAVRCCCRIPTFPRTSLLPYSQPWKTKISTSIPPLSITFGHSHVAWNNHENLNRLRKNVKDKNLHLLQRVDIELAFISVSLKIRHITFVCTCIFIQIR